MATSSGAGSGQQDVTSLVITLTDPPTVKLVFALALASPIAPPSAFASDSLVGYLATETDQNATLSYLSSVDFANSASLGAAGPAGVRGGLPGRAAV